MNTPTRSVLSGIQPTGATHLGNYLGALRWWVDFQDRFNAFYCVVDLHALTVPGDPAELTKATLDMATLLLACGLDPARCTLFVQSHVPEHAELAWLLECTASMGELSRMTQFKDKAAKGGVDAARVGLFTYPVLMAADILAYDADLVPVGDDQRQHLELTRDLAHRWNTRYGPTFKLPEAAIAPQGGAARVMDLQDPAHKMSKTADSDAGVVYLLDDPKVIERKIKRAVTDLDPPGPSAVRWDVAAKPGVSNLLELISATRGGTPDELAGSYTSYGQLKADAADAVIAALQPLQARYRDLAADPASVQAILADGAARARETAATTYQRARGAIGLLSIADLGPALADRRR
ncbi:MAG TPA: tryptophan--tRNA ligase [Acidimicrobiales bacterium]|nr:tryptophan--tRNA ligase [Acidimicrobiales bacterium]